MVAPFVRLKLTLMANTFRRSVWQAVGFILGALQGLAIVALAVVGAVVGGWQAPELTGEIITIAGALVVLCWWVVPVFLFGVDATLDPQRFATYAMPRRSLLAGLSAASLVTIPGAMTVLAVLGVTLAWLRSPVTLAAAVVGAALAVALCVVGSRAATTALSFLTDSRRSREFLTLVALVAVVALSPVINLLALRLGGIEMTAEQVRLALSDVAAVAGWTPMGAPWGLAEGVFHGQWLMVLGRLAVAVVTLAALWLLWGWALTRSFEQPRSGSAKRVKGLGWLDRCPATPTGAVAARAATYWLRDPRYSGSLMAIPVLPVILIVVAQTAGEDQVTAVVALVLAPFTAWMIGFFPHNDIAFDHTAYALHLTTGVSGLADRWGRVLPVLVMGVPVTILLAVLGVVLAGRPGWLPPLLGLSLGTLTVSTGLSAALSARWLYPVAKPGESPFKQPQGAMAATLAAQGVNMGLATVVSLPAFGLALAAFLISGTAGLLFGWATALVGLAVGVTVLVWGVRWGGRALDRRGPELLLQVTSYGS